MRWWLLPLAVLALIQALLALMLMPDHRDIYIPAYISVCVSCALSCLVGLASARYFKVLFWAAIAFQLPMLALWHLAAESWPGAHDGTGLFWIFGIGSGVVLCCFVALAAAAHAAVRAMRERRTELHD